MSAYLKFPAVPLLLFVWLNGCHKEQQKPFVLPADFHTSAIVLAGNGTQGDKDGVDTAATFNTIWGIAMDAAGNVYVTDNGNVQIRKITPQGVVSTLADNPNTSGSMIFSNADGIVIDAAGYFYVSYSANCCIRKISPDGKTGVIFAGSPIGEGGDVDGTGTSARFEVPVGMAIDGSGNIYVADSGNGKIRKITPAGVVTTLAGTGNFGSADGPAAQAQFYEPYGVAVDKSGNVYVADGYNYKVRKISADGTVSTIAGTGDVGALNGTAKSATFDVPTGVAVADDGTLYVTDYADGLVRIIATNGLVSWLGGDVAGFVNFYSPTDLIIDKSGTLYVADSGNNRVMKVIPQKSTN